MAAKRSAITGPRNKLADHAVAFVSNLTLVGDFAGQPFKPMPYFQGILRKLFGTLNRAGKRQIKKAFWKVPRKQAKTTQAAAIVIYWLLGRGLQAQQIISVANDRIQAGLLFDAIREMIEADPELSELCEIIPSTKRIVVPSTGSYYVALSSESRSKTGYSPSLVIFDEFQDQRDPDLIKNLTTGFGAREDYLTLYICTAGNRPDVPYLAEYEYAKQIAAGTLVNPEYGAFIFEASPEDPWDDEATWRKAMPGLGISCNLDFIRSECEAAKQQPAKKSWFLQYYLNIDQHYGGAGGWLDDEAWTACNAQQIGFKGQAFGALDMASISDTTSFVIQGENIEGGVDLIPYIWVCEAQIAKRRSAEFDYLAWERSGHMRVTEGEMQDQEKIFADILEACEQYSVSKIAIDRWNTGWMGPRLVEAGIEVVGFGQGFKDMSPAIKEFERLLRARRLRHGGNPVMRWMRANIRCDTDAAGNVKFNKQKSTEKIDGMIAAAMAIGLSMPGVDGDLSGGESVYEKRGVEFF